MRYEHYYINLDCRSDRRKTAEETFKRFGLPAHRVSASTGGDQVPSLNLSTCGAGNRTCFISHYRLLENHLQECERTGDLDHVLAIYEDNVRLCDDFRMRLEYLENKLLKNGEWDMCFLGSSFTMIRPIGIRKATINRLGSSTSTAPTASSRPMPTWSIRPAYRTCSICFENMPAARSTRPTAGYSRR